MCALKSAPWLGVSLNSTWVHLNIQKYIFEHESNKMNTSYNVKICIHACIPCDYISFLRESLCQKALMPEYELPVQKKWFEAVSV